MKSVTEIDWPSVRAALHENGFAQLTGLLSPQECEALQQSYSESSRYRSIINMKRYRFGEGEYKYFQYPLPAIVQTLRKEFYAPLATLANDWMTLLSVSTEFPTTHEALLAKCLEKNQGRPTPLILHYQAGGYNTLHQDLYGEVYFPFQMVCVLTRPGNDHHGGELVLTEQVPRAQSKATVLSPHQGDAVIFTTNFRPVKGSRGYYRATMKHGISRVTAGHRYSLGIIFHDAL